MWRIKSRYRRKVDTGEKSIPEKSRYWRNAQCVYNPSACNMKRRPAICRELDICSPLPKKNKLETCYPSPIVNPGQHEQANTLPEEAPGSATGPQTAEKEKRVERAHRHEVTIDPVASIIWVDTVVLKNK
jgi:hypothetical protein